MAKGPTQQAVVCAIVAAGGNAGVSYMHEGFWRTAASSVGCFLFVMVLITWMDRRRERRTTDSERLEP
ncbi:MAG TPA: hypothetical protein VHV76_11560 [Mycobacteriales bacterium]|jgi:hypothetical protein|nr:hypothetical protein [Mycobacteriales bacterium]